MKRYKFIRYFPSWYGKEHTKIHTHEINDIKEIFDIKWVKDKWINEMGCKNFAKSKKENVVPWKEFLWRNCPNTFVITQDIIAESTNKGKDYIFAGLQLHPLQKEITCYDEFYESLALPIYNYRLIDNRG